MTTHTDLVAAFASDLVTAGVLSAAAQLYSGRRPQNVKRTDLEVWAELEGREEIGTGAQRVVRHAYLLHLRGAPTNAGAAGTGEEQLETVEAAAETVVARYHAQLPSTLGAALSGSLAWCRAQIEELDEDPDDNKRASLAVRLELAEAF